MSLMSAAVEKHVMVPAKCLFVKSENIKRATHDSVVFNTRSGFKQSFW